jgi:hypothetical protein
VLAWKGARRGARGSIRLEPLDPEERARLLERPEVIEAIGKHVIAEMRAGRVAQPQ